MTSPRFSPIPSDYGSRALSPTLSASSRTTTSLPTDVSDLSSLDGDEDFEMIDAPRSDRDEATDGDDDDLLHSQGLTESFDDIAFRNSSLLSNSMLSRSDEMMPRGSTAFTDQRNFSAKDASDANQEMEDSNLLHSSHSLTPLMHSGMLESSTTSSQLKFPDPLDSSFQQLDSGNMTLTQETKGTPRMEQHDDEEVNDMADRATLTDFGEKNVVQAHDFENENIDAGEEKNSGLEIKQASEAPSTPAFPAPPNGFPFKLDRIGLASKTFRALVTILMVLLASGVMPVWRNGSTSTLSSSPSTIKMATNTSFASPTPFTQLNKSLSVITSKASKGLIAVSKASSFGTPKCPKEGISGRGKRGRKAIEMRLPTESASVEKGITNVKSAGEVAVFKPEMSYSALAAEWLLATPSKVSPIAMLKQKEPMIFGIGSEFDLLSRIDRPSRAAKSIVGNLKKTYLSTIDEYSGNDYVQFIASLAAKESKMLQTEIAKIARNIPPKTRQLLAALQKSWDVWMVELMKAYTNLRLVVGEEMSKVQDDFGRAYRRSDRVIRKFSKEVVGRHRALEELTDCQLKLFSLYTRKDIEYKQKLKFYMKLQQSAWKSIPKTLNEAKEACNQLKLVAHTYKPQLRPFGKKKKHHGRSDVFSFANSLRKRSNKQIKHSIKAIKRARRQAVQALRRP